ncbi:putative reverse transcriptase domain-containing protein [Tanacetum coccineum]|uniref:Reverse transcriptase domain-containing protein n=1 Tax=Tanacetum coccineum TaxID=301880 RepID=A0ABQ5DDE5_9ASTR
MVSAIISATSSSEYSWSENKLKPGDLNLSRLSVLKCLMDDRNSRSGSSKGKKGGFSLTDWHRHRYAVSSLMDMAYWLLEQLLLLQDECVVARRPMHWSKRKGKQRISIMKYRVEKDLYWTRVQAHEFYQEMICRGVVFEERPNEAIDVPVKDEESPSSEPRDPLMTLSSLVLLAMSFIVTMPPKARPMNQAAIMITLRINEALTTDRARRVNASGAVELRRWFEKTEMVFGINECAEGKKVKFVAATLQRHALTWWNSKVATIGLKVVNQIPWNEMKQWMTAEFYPAEEVQRMEHELWNLKVKEFNIVAYTQRFNELALMCSRMVDSKSVKINAYIRGLSKNIKGDVTSSKLANLSEGVRMAHKLMEQKLQAKKERDIEGNKRKWENFQSGNSSRGNYKDNSCHQQNNQKQGNARAMTIAPNESNAPTGPLPLCDRCFEKNVATGANAHPIWTCYDCGEQGHTRSHCPKKNKPQSGNASGRSYVIKDADKQGPNVVTDINLDKLDVSYEVELADGKVVSTNMVLRGCTLNLVNHLFEIDLMPIELDTFDIIIGMDWLAECNAIIICGKKVVRIPCGNKTLIVEGDKGPSRLKKKSKEKRLKDVPVIRDFPKVFPNDLLGLPPPRQVEFRIDLVSGAA